MSRAIRRALFACVTAVAIAPLTIRGQEISTAPSSQPNVPQGAHWHAAGHAAYNQPHSTPDATQAVHAPPVNAPHGYVPHDPSLPPHGPTEAPTGSNAKQFSLWEQSSDALELKSHSWNPPLVQESLGHWDVAMSTTLSEEHVLLVPGGANRTGQLWHRQAIPAGEFEVQFGFGAFGKDQAIHEATGGVQNGVSIPDGFAFWYVYEPYASVYPRTPAEQASWNVVGYKSNPKGFGVIFKAMDQSGQINPSISCIHNTEDGGDLAEKVPSSSALFFQYRNQTAPVLFRVIVNRQGVVAQIRENATSAWITACSLDHLILRPNGFIGFTGYNRPVSGQGEVAGQEHQQHFHEQQQGGDQVLLYFVKAWSLESTASSQGAPVPQNAVHPPQGGHIATDNHVQQAHTENTGGIPGVAHHSPYMYHNYTYADPTVVRMLTSIGNQISMLSVEVSHLRHDVRRLWGEEGSDAVKSIKSELTGFKDLFKRHSQQHTSALHSIHRQVEKKSSTSDEGHAPILSRLTDLSSQLENGVAVKHAPSFFFSVAALLLVVLFALFSWRKLQDIEKKHML